MPPKEIIAYRLRKIRKFYSMSQKGAARLLGVAPSLLADWENGKRMPSEKYMWRIEALYQTLFASIYPERRQAEIAIVAKNIRLYGPKGTDIDPKERPP